ncbi:hypothetical protein MOE81_07245 [Bacillus inaquosorum]|nr:hypothetical protein [Bacillus inaquosorum]MCY9057731.1 hypothetical protein [Bacillus inaquosorum]
MEGELTAYQKSWKYLFVVQSISKLIEMRELNGETIKEDLAEAKKVLSSLYGNPSPTLVDVIKSKFSRVQTIGTPNLSFLGIEGSFGEISFEEINSSEKLKQQLKSNAFRLLDYFEGVLINNLKKEKIFIILDQLDESWLNSEIEEYSKILINLINTCKMINTNEIYNNKLKVVPFLRTDIYETLHFNDKNKIYQDNATEIMWNEDSLNDMFVERITNYKPEQVDLELQNKTDCLFEVRYVRHGATPFKHIIRRSFLRPRDIIVYLNKINETHTETKTGLFSSKDLYAAEKDFSVSIYNEIIDEWINQKPEIAELLAVLQNIGYQTFKYTDFESKYISAFTENSSKVKSELNFLFHNSIVGQKINANWEYQCGNPYMTIDFEKEFHVNSALKSRLMLTEGQA